MQKESINMTGFLLLFLLVGSLPVWAEWQEYGVPICIEAENQTNPQIVSDNVGGAFIIWEDYRNGIKEIYAQRINADGDIAWINNGQSISTLSGSHEEYMAVTDGLGGVLIIWLIQINNEADIFVQRIDVDGNLAWNNEGVVVHRARGCSISYPCYSPQIIADGTGGAFIVWADYFEDEGNIYIDRVLYDGTLIWENEITVCDHDGMQFWPKIVSDSSGGAIVLWLDWRGDDQSGIYLQKLNENGLVQWAENGVAICTLGCSGSNPQIVSDGNHGVLVAWDDSRSGGDEIYSQRLNMNGNILWVEEGIPICTALGQRGNVQLSTDDVGGAIITWEDRRSCDVGGNCMPDIYAQRIDSIGNVIWQHDGVPICAAIHYQQRQHLVSNSLGEAIITWMDCRHEDPEGPGCIWSVYAQGINSSGITQWEENGIPVCTSLGSHYNPRICTDGLDGAIITWQDFRSGDASTNIYALRINVSGEPVATALQSFLVQYRAPSVDIKWTVSEIDEDVRFVILRGSGSPIRFIEIKPDVVTRDGVSFVFKDSDLEPGMTYWYRVDILYGDERSALFESDPVCIPAISLSLFQNHPNPFNPTTTINYYLPENCPVLLEIFDVSGKRIATLINESQEKGQYSMEWNGQDQNGNAVSSGTYFYRLKAGKETISKKMILLR